MVVSRDVIGSFSSKLKVGSFKIALGCIRHRNWLGYHIFIGSSTWWFHMMYSSWICLASFSQRKIVFSILFNHFSSLISHFISSSSILMDALSLLDQILSVGLRWHLFFTCKVEMGSFILLLLCQSLILWNVDVLQILCPGLHGFPVSRIIWMDKLKLFNWSFLFKKHIWFLSYLYIFIQ